MKTTIKDIKPLIVTKLQGLMDNESPQNVLIGEVFDYANGDFSKYPVAVVRSVGGKGGVEDTHRIERVFSFTITLYQEQSKAGETKDLADQKMTDISDAILTAFDTDKDLGGELQIVRVVDFDFDFAVRAGTFNFATFRVDCVVMVPSY